MGGFYKVVNIKEDMPTVDVALKRVEMNIATCRGRGPGAIKIIHGYGSGGTGGKIRVATRKFLALQKEQGRIADYIEGESFSIFTPATLEAFRRCPELRADEDLEKHNNGITIIVM